MKDLILVNSNTALRKGSSQVAVHAINVIISLYNLDLDSKKIQSDQNVNSILQFLDLLLGSIPSETTRLWLSSEEYFEFWRDFAAAGTSQVRYLYQKHMIAILIDFLLQNNSPLRTKPSNIALATTIEWDSQGVKNIMQTIATLIEKSKPISGEAGLSSDGTEVFY